jgi:hypothetical protein
MFNVKYNKQTKMVNIQQPRSRPIWPFTNAGTYILLAQKFVI